MQNGDAAVDERIGITATGVGEIIAAIGIEVPAGDVSRRIGRWDDDLLRDASSAIIFKDGQ